MNDPANVRAPSDPSADDGYPRPVYAWYVIGVLTLLYVFSIIDRFILNLLVAPIRRDLQISDTGISLLIGFGFALFYTFFGLPLARIADSRSRRGMIGTGVAVWSLFCTGCGVASTFSQLLIMRMGIGVGEASLSPAAYSLITDYFPPHRRATATGIYGIGIAVGAGLAFIIGGAAIALASARSEWVLPLIGSIRPWQMVFFIIGPPGLLLSLLMLTVAEPLRRGAGSATRIPLSEVLKFMRKSRATLTCHNIGSGFVLLAGYADTAWIPTFFIRHHHWSAALTGEVYGLITAIFGALGVAYGGFLADRLAKRGHRDACMRVMLLSSLLWFPTGIAYLLVPSAALSAVLLAPTAFIAMMFYGVAPAALMEIAPARMRGQAGALYILIATLIGGLIGATSVALLTDYVFHDDNMVGYSLLIVTIIAHMSSAAFFWAGLKPFVRSRDYLKDLAVAVAS